MRLAHFLLSTLFFTTAQTVPAELYGQHVFADKSVLAEGLWIKVSLDGQENGVYQITYEQLRKMGFSQPQQVGIYGFGGNVLSEDFKKIPYDDLPEVAIYQDTKNNRILFYGQGLIKWEYDASDGFYHRQNTYETKAYYFLHQKAEEPRQMQSLSSTVSVASQFSDTYLAHELHESDLVNIGQTGREKYGESFISNKTQRFSMGTFDAGEIRIKANMIAKSTEATSYDVRVNDQSIRNVNIDNTSSSYTFATEGFLDERVSLEGKSDIEISLTYQATGKADIARLNYIEVEGRRSFSLPASFITFRDPDTHTGFDLSGAYSAETSTIASSAYQVWDVTSATDVKLQQLSDNATFVPTTTELHEYVWVNTESMDFPSVTSAGKITNQNLHALEPTDFVIITAPAYLSEANRLAEYRRHNDGLSVVVLTPQAIYNEFSSGGQDATAIRLLMKRLQPRYLLLFGKGHYDNQKINRQYYLPTYETDYSLSETASCVCDDYFGFTEDGEGGIMDTHHRYSISNATLDIGIGRLPVSNEAEAKAVIDKIITYSNNRYQGDWKSHLCFLSDDDKAGDSFNAHVQHNDQLVRSLEKSGHKEYVMQKIYLPAYKQTTTASGTDYPDARKEFLERLKEGVLLVNYAGHGNTSSITHEQIMTSSLATQLSMRYLPVWVTASCDVGRWDNEDISMGEHLTLNSNGGAIAMFTTVRVVYAHQNLIINQAIIDNLFDRFSNGTRYRLGDVLKASKRALGSDYNKLNFCLMGDPSLIMAFPEKKIEVTQLNGKAVSDTEQFVLQALEPVTLKGHILKTGTESQIDSTFNGIIFPTFFDALDTLTADKGYVQDGATPYTFTTRTRKVFRGRGEVKNGQFEFSFIVPQDISAGEKTGLATLYACSDQWDEAQGYFDRYALAGGTEIVKTDSLGPEIRNLFLNDMLFSEGAVVNSTPYFYAEVTDESGFNTTGNGIGHDMVLTIKCTSNPLLSVKQYILNNYFSTYSGRYDIGSVQYSIPALEDGDYEASFTVWDVYNNATRRVFHFTVGKSIAPNSVSVQAYPSPAKQQEPLTFRVLHNRPESETEMKVEVFNALGHLVYEAKSKISQTEKYYAKDMEHPTVANTSLLADETPNFMGSSTIEWSSPDLQPGFYVYHIILTSNGSQKTSDSKILIINE